MWEIKKSTASFILVLSLAFLSVVNSPGILRLIRHADPSKLHWGYILFLPIWVGCIVALWWPTKKSPDLGEDEQDDS